MYQKHFTLHLIDWQATYEDLEASGTLQQERLAGEGLRYSVENRMEVTMERWADHLCVLLKDQDGLPIGYYYCEIQNNTKLRLFDLFVEPYRRNEWCATEMLCHVIETAKQRWYEKVRFTVPHKFREYARYNSIVQKLIGLWFKQHGGLNSWDFSWDNK